MKALFDTSVLIAALVKNHPVHGPAAEWLDGIHQQRLEGVISAHAVAELYATLSAMPSDPLLSPKGAVEVIQQNVVSYFSIRSLDAKRYLALIRRLADVGLSGGVIYDAVHAEVARRVGVDVLVTLNLRDFHRVWQGTRPWWFPSSQPHRHNKGRPCSPGIHSLSTSVLETCP